MKRKSYHWLSVTHPGPVPSLLLHHLAHDIWSSSNIWKEALLDPKPRPFGHGAWLWLLWLRQERHDRQSPRWRYTWVVCRFRDHFEHGRLETKIFFGKKQLRYWLHPTGAGLRLSMLHQDVYQILRHEATAPSHLLDSWMEYQLGSNKGLQLILFSS